MLLFSGNRVLVFSGLLCLIGALYLSGELLQLFQQVLVGDAKRFHLVRVDLHKFKIDFIRFISKWVILNRSCREGY